MTSQAQGQRDGWIITNKSSKSSKKPKAISPKLLQTSMHDFLQRKAPIKPKKLQKENVQVDPPSTLKKRKIEQCHDFNDKSAPKKKQKKDAHPEVVMPVGPPLHRGNGLEQSRNDCGTSSLSPIIVPDSLDAVSWDGSTVWDSATTARTLRVEQSHIGPCALKRKMEIDNSLHLSSIYNALPATPLQERRNHMKNKYFFQAHSSVLPRDPFIEPQPDCASHSVRDFLVPSSQSQEHDIVASQHDSYPGFLLPSTQTYDMRFSQPPILVPHSPDVDHEDEEDIPISMSIVPSSQSQYLLPYQTSPARQALATRDVCANDQELVPSSQSQFEHELYISSQSRSATSRQVPTWDTEPVLPFSVDLPGTVNNSAATHREPTTFSRGPSLEAFQTECTSGHSAHTTLHAMPSPSSGHSPLCSPSHEGSSRFTKPNSPFANDPPDSCEVDTRAQAHILAPLVPEAGHLPATSRDDNEAIEILRDSMGPSGMPSPTLEESLPVTDGFSPLDVPVGHESQYTFVEETCPSSILEFFDDIDRDYGLGPEFKDSSPQCLTEVEENVIEALEAGQSQEILPESFPSSIPMGPESQYTFVEESYPPDVTDFLDNLDASLGSEF
ncbi:hypothetical protein K439DRAFT_1657403 [Ramaria rubella]|nr:hypothetical protein K439DRAFT_1657403 [Ramaria rubella]